MKYQRAEISTLLTIGMVIFLGAATVVSSLFLKDRQVLKSKAADTGFCRDNPDPGRTPAGYNWKADCAKQCHSNADCPQNTSDPSNVNPSTSNWCYGFQGSTGTWDDWRCLMLFKGSAPGGSGSQPTATPVQSTIPRQPTPQPTAAPAQPTSSSAQPTPTPKSIDTSPGKCWYSEASGKCYEGRCKDKAKPCSFNTNCEWPGYTKEVDCTTGNPTASSTGLKSSGASCIYESECQSGYCGPDGLCVARPASSISEAKRRDGEQCDNNLQCQSNNCGGICQPKTTGKICSSSPNDYYFKESDQCYICKTDGTASSVSQEFCKTSPAETKRSNSQQCDNNSQCQSDNCRGGTCQPKTETVLTTESSKTSFCIRPNGQGYKVGEGYCDSYNVRTCLNTGQFGLTKSCFSSKGLRCLETSDKKADCSASKVKVTVTTSIPDNCFENMEREIKAVFIKDENDKVLDERQYWFSGAFYNIHETFSLDSNLVGKTLKASITLKHYKKPGEEWFFPPTKPFTLSMEGSQVLIDYQCQ